MNEQQQQALITLCRTLELHWSDLPIEICNAWEAFENATPDGPFRDELRGE